MSKVNKHSANRSKRIPGRASKKRTGIERDSDLSALANTVLEGKFVQTFRESRGKVDRDIKLGFYRQS